MSEGKSAIYDYDNKCGLLIRCPYCNAFDRNLDNYAGLAKCDECDKLFHVEHEVKD